MISIPASNAVDGGFQLQSVQTNDYNVGICCFSAKRTDLNEKEQRLVVDMLVFNITIENRA